MDEYLNSFYDTRYFCYGTGNWKHDDFHLQDVSCLFPWFVFLLSPADSNSPIDVSALLGKLLAHGIKVEKKDTDLNVPAISLNMEELRK